MHMLVMTMTESNNVFQFADFKKKSKHPEYGKNCNNDNQVTKELKQELEEQPLPVAPAKEDNYHKFVNDPMNGTKLEFILNETMKAISLEYGTETCTIGDFLFLKEAVVSLIMRSALQHEHPFQKMADGLEATYLKADS